MQIRIGITGGIGAGKSIVCKLLETLGYPVFYSDHEAKSAMQNDTQLRSEIISIFGEKAFLSQNLNREFLAREIFSNPIKKEKLNALVHPVVRKNFEIWANNQDSELVFNESALLFETGSHKRFDACILVVANLEERIHRVTQRDQISREEVENRIKNQLSDSEKLKFDPLVIQNKDSDLLMPQLVTILNKVSKLGK